MNKTNCHIVAKHKVTERWRDMYYPSIEDAEKNNPDFEWFRYVGVKK